MLDSRKATVLRAIVRDYVRTGAPVGSKSLAQRHRLKVSAATIRNDMSLLEELGYIEQPHTSAGRIPTDLGYRWFVDNSTGPPWPALNEKERKRVDHLRRSRYRGLDEALEDTSHVLSDLTESTALVVGPPIKQNNLRRLELLPREDGRATLLLIADSGEVEQGVVELPELKNTDEIVRLGNQLNGQLEGVAFEDLARSLRTGRPRGASKRIADEIDSILAHSHGERIFRGGTANILSPEKFPDMAVAHEVVDALERPSSISSFVQAATRAGGLLVFIGKEVPVRQMRACAVVFTPYDVGTDRRGTLGVVGPTRMDYPHVMATVVAVSQSLTELFSTLED